MGLRRILLVGVTGALVFAGTATGYAFADGKKKHEPSGDVTQTSQTTQDGNTQEVDVIDVNVCGNSVNVLGLLNPAFGNVCTNF